MAQETTGTPKAQLAEVEKAFAMFVSSVEGHVVPRFESPGTWIGASRKVPTGADPELGWKWHTDRIEAVPHGAMARHRGDYRRAIARGALKERKAEEFLAQQTRVQAKEEAAAAKVVAAAAAAAEAEAKAKNDHKPPAGGE